MSNKLIRVTEDVVRAERAPEFTATWRPYAHADVLDAMALAVRDSGMEVVSREYSLRPESRMMAAWEIRSERRGFNFGVSILNAIDKSAAVVLSVFERIFVCSNWCFRMDHARVMFRKHSGRLEMAELNFMARAALNSLIPHFEALKKWHDGMRAVRMTTAQAALITFAAMKRKVVPPAKFDCFFDLYAGPESKYADDRNTLWAWHAAATELMNGNNLMTIANDQNRLNYFIDYEAPRLLSSSNAVVVDLRAIEKDAFMHYKEGIAARKETVREGAARARTAYLAAARNGMAGAVKRLSA
jgi:hypothetical protein